MMAVCTGTVSYLAVNRQANAASHHHLQLTSLSVPVTPVLPYHGIAQYLSAAARSQTTSLNTAPLVPAAGQLAMLLLLLHHILSPVSLTTKSTKYALLLKQPPVQAPIRQSSLQYRMLLQLSLKSTLQQTSHQDKLSPYRGVGSCRKGRRLCRWQAMTSPLMLSLQMAQYIVGVLIAMVSLAMVQTPTPTPLSP